jgi:hypothetical protein
MMNLKQKVSRLIPIAYLKSISQTKKILVGIAIGSVSLFGSCKKDKVDTETLNLNADGAQSSTAALAAASIPTKAEALLAMEVYNNHFYNQYGTYGSSFKAYYWKDDNHTGRMDFWTQQEAIETLIDAYNINPSVDLKNKIIYLYNGVRDGYGLLWSNNIYNDDIVWGALMCVRAFKITNDGGMLDMAKNNFNMMWKGLGYNVFRRRTLVDNRQPDQKYLCKCACSNMRDAFISSNWRC